MAPVDLSVSPRDPITSEAEAESEEESPPSEELFAGVRADFDRQVGWFKLFCPAEFEVESEGGLGGAKLRGAKEGPEDVPEPEEAPEAEVEKTGAGEAPLPEVSPEDEGGLDKTRLESLESAEVPLFPEEEPEDAELALAGAGALELFPDDEAGGRLDPEPEEGELGGLAVPDPVGAKTVTRFLPACEPPAGTEFSGLKSTASGCAKLFGVGAAGVLPEGTLGKFEAAKSGF